MLPDPKMPATKNSDPQRSLQITQHDKFYSRLLSKEVSPSAPSFRVYYAGASGAVPFEWESQPGTPKHAKTTSTLPPLTPPPSYHFNPKKSKKSTKSSSPKIINGLMHCILPGLSPRKTGSLSSSPSVSSSSGSSGSHQRGRFSNARSLSEDNESDEEGSPTSTLRYSGGLRGCYSMVIVKNALLSIVGSHGSSQGTAA